jgi:glycosyltransferase involved in cell wall biosynthesis
MAYTLIDETRERPSVSVAMLVYNHERYIAEAIESVLMQKTTFSVQLVIAEDFSSDGTRSILFDYQKRFSDKIKLILQNKNVGLRQNKFDLFLHLQGDYIAVLEGDDYWTDSFKLQKQVNFLENNLDYAMSMGKVQILIEKTGLIKKKKEHVNPANREFFTLKDYLKAPFSHTSTFLFKKEVVKFPNWFWEVYAADQSLVVIVAKTGKIKYHNELFSIYRQNEHSITYSRDLKKFKKEDFFNLNNINTFTSYRYDWIIKFRKLNSHILALKLNSRNKLLVFLCRIINQLIYRVIKWVF